MSATLSQYTITEIKQKDIKTSNILNIPQISEYISIVDSRLLKDFKDQTFGGYKLAQASSALEKAILEDKIEPALHWTLQLFLSGVVQPLWNMFIAFACKSINIYNVKLPEFIYNKSIQWHHIVDNVKFNKDNILLLRNHPTLRLLLAEMVTILCLSKKRKLIQLPKIKKNDKQNDFIIDNFKSKLEAPDNHFINNLCIDGDPSEIKIAINEFALHIYNGNTNKSLYWINWIIEWEKLNSKKYGKYECGIRVINGVDGKYYKDVVWLIWDMINKIKNIKYTNTNTHSGNVENNINVQISYLYKLYINNFTPSARTKKQNYIIWSILYMTETLDNTIPLVDKPHLLFQSLLGFDKIIAHLKSQEVHHIVNNNLTNVVIENNYMLTEKHKELEINKFLQVKALEEKEKQSKQKKNQNIINTESMDKLNEIYKLDRMMFA